MPRSQYEQFAEKCVELARTTQNDQAKAALLHWRKSGFVWQQAKWEKLQKRTPLTVSVRISCQFSPTLCHFSQNSLVGLKLDVISEAVALLVKLQIWLDVSMAG